MHTRYWIFHSVAIIVLAFTLPTAIADDDKSEYSTESDGIPFIVTQPTQGGLVTFPEVTSEAPVKNFRKDEIADMLDGLIAQLSPALEKAARQKQGGYQVDSVEMHLILSAEGGFKIIGTAGIEGGIKLTFRRPADP